MLTTWVQSRCRKISTCYIFFFSLSIFCSPFRECFVPVFPKTFFVPLYPKIFCLCSRVPQLKLAMFPCSPKPLGDPQCCLRENLIAGGAIREHAAREIVDIKNCEVYNEWHLMQRSSLKKRKVIPVNQGVCRRKTFCATSPFY